MTLAVSSSAAAGTYTINVIGTGAAGISEDAIVTLTVTSTTGSNLIQNGGFETGSLKDWTKAGATAATVSKVEAHSGSYSALLGKKAAPEINGTTSISQAVTIPSSAGAATLTFWYYPGTTDTITYAYQEVLIKNSSGTTLATVMKVASNTKAWTEITYDLSSYAGQTITLFFAVVGNGYSKDYVYMFVDDISVTAQ